MDSWNLCIFQGILEAMFKAEKLLKKPFILPLLILFTYATLLLDTLKYPGFVGNHFFISSLVYFAIAVTLLIFLNTESKIMIFVFRLNRVVLVITLFAYIILGLVEGAHFTNYILNTLHIHLDGMAYPLLFNFSILLVEKFKHLMPKSSGRTKIAYPITILFLVYFAAGNMGYVTTMAFERSSYIPFHLKDSYDDKMYYRWGDFYRFMLFVKQNTPETATIIVPPEQNPWLIGSGNPNFVRSFLYPRKVVSEKLIIPEESLQKFDPETYLLISWGKEVCSPEPACHGWPRQEIKAQKIIFKDPDSAQAVEIKENAVYTLKDKKYVYGLIKPLTINH